MKNTYLIILNCILLLMVSACTSTPPKKEMVRVEESPTHKEVITTTYECYGDPNLDEPTTLKQKLHEGKDLNGVILNCAGDTVVVDTILDYGPEQVNILDISTGMWKTYSLKDCRILSNQ